jgi:hypothetical protein
MKKSILSAFDGPPEKKTEPPKPRYDIDELLGPEPPGYRRRLAWYEHLRKEVEKKK